MEGTDSYKNRLKKEKRDVSSLIAAAEEDSKILAVFLFGSAAREDNHKKSDLDVCLIMKRGAYSPMVLSRKKLEYLKLYDMDVQIFQQLPLYIRIRIIKEGKKLFCANEDELYQAAFQTISEFDDFKHFYYDYLKEVSSVG